MFTDWEQVLLAYLHDPPDKALDIRGHESRATALARVAFDREIERAWLHRETRTEDQLGSASERLTLPTAGQSGERAVGPEQGCLLVYHPLSGNPRELNVAALSEEAPGKTLTELVQDLDTPRRRLLALWRFWRERLSAQATEWGLLPADTRLPDHTIWNHLDIVAGLRPALSGNHGIGFLSFSLGPVQTFIAAARTLRDLWTGSYLLSWLTFQAMRPILEAAGPAAFVFPALRGIPLLDEYLLAEEGLRKQVELPDKERLLLPCLPNRFLALVSWGREGEDARQLASQCESACHKAWADLAGKVHHLLDERWRSLPHAGGWDRLWDEQIETCFEVRTTVLPERQWRDEAFEHWLDEDLRQRIADVRRLAAAIPGQDRPGGYGQQSAGLWMGQMEALGRLSEVSRSVRHVPDYHPDGETPGKCSLLGTYEQMGPARLQESTAFWQAAAEAPLRGSRVRAGERLCAVSLVKRFAWPAFFAGELGIKPEERRFADTATGAAADWLRQGQALDPEEVWKQDRTWSGQWLHWRQPDQEAGEDRVPPLVWERIQQKRRQQGAAPAYYAILMMDGDQMGQWLRGQKTPSIAEVLHPKLRSYFGQLPDASAGLQAHRPVGPALHAAISEALANFALHFVPAIVARHAGELVYAGGDDVLALLPTATALSCARELACTFAENWRVDDRGRERLLMGSRATVSAGLAVVHSKEDLRFALEAARQAEKSAKRQGRDALVLTVCRRSGEHTSALLPWSECARLEELIRLFAGGVSDRWAYRLRAELPTLQGEDIPWQALQAETGRLLDRLEQGDREQIRTPALAFLESYRQAMAERDRPTAQTREDFVILCQVAAFLARGREER